MDISKGCDMPLSKNDIVLVDYVVRVKESGEVIEVTDAEKAKEFKVFDPGKSYEPLLVVLGEGRVIKGFEEALESSEVGVDAEVDIPPDKAYGVRDPNKVKTLSLRDFARAGVRPEVGKVVEVGGQLGTVRSVSGGRVVVDFNHPLAGKTLTYSFRVVKKLDEPVEKVKYLVKRYVRGVNVDDVKVSVDSESSKVSIELPRNSYFSENIQIAKKLASDDIFKYLNFNEVIFIERYSKEGSK
ncbi:MAG: FKBP-type peptidyl-prolyl cis-trans isomerase [Sulfolobales archaeon]|nr:FKBP-type peptidyl-prolyl cis-trans isomerase [Sulfolobales archaeon]